MGRNCADCKPTIALSSVKTVTGIGNQNASPGSRISSHHMILEFVKLLIRVNQPSMCLFYTLSKEILRNEPCHGQERKKDSLSADRG